jgi:CBS domain-containing protein
MLALAALGQVVALLARSEAWHLTIELGQGDGKVVTIGADDPLDEALQTMSEHQVRRLPVIDGHELVGMVSQADIARN